jgi:beta-glucuronidase
MNEYSTRIRLAGVWDMYIGDVWYRTVPVPSSYHPVGVATLKRTLPRDALVRQGRMLLVFEGTANEAEVSLAGRPLGRMVGFTRHVFDVTDLLLTAEPELAVTLRDLNAALGTSPGWEGYGGIIRDVYLQPVPDLYLADLYCHSSISAERADLTVEMELCNASPLPAPAVIHVAVQDMEGLVVAETTIEQTVAPDTVTLSTVTSIEQPRLWSPDDPYLYAVRVDVRSTSGEHTAQRRVGIRTVEVRGRRFYLNGRPLFLKGVCRHDTWLEQGYTLTREQMRHDMRDIKALGANFVRLVHYPHHPEILDLADELGLFVTEEPPLWNVHLDDPSMRRPKEVALEMLRRTILRDRGHPSVFAWLLGNECWPANTYINDGKRLCNALDPGRLVGFSHFNSDEGGIRASFRDLEWDPDFHDVHPYYNAESLYRTAMREFPDRPLIFGEWGGYWVWHDDWLLEQIGRSFAAAAHAPADAAEQLSGMAYWEWADTRQYNRGYPACTDGVLTEGLVTEDRQRKPVWEMMRRIFQAIDAGPSLARPATFGRVVADRAFPADLVPLNLASPAQSADQQRAWRVVAPAYAEWQSLPPELPATGCRLAQVATGRPLLLSPLAPRVRLDVQRHLSEIWLMGLGTLGDGYPLAGHLGDRVLRLVAKGQGINQDVWLRNGHHIARQNILYQGSRIEPVTLDAGLLFEWVADPDHDIRQVRVFTWRLPQPLDCTYLELDLVDGHTSLVLHAISVR